MVYVGRAAVTAPLSSDPSGRYGSEPSTLAYTRPICLPQGMKDEDRAIEIEFAIMALFVAGSFIAGLVAAVKCLVG